MSLTENQQRSLADGRLISGGVAAVEVAAVVQLLQLTSLTPLLNAALWCFSVSLPVLVLCFSEYAIAPRANVADSMGWPIVLLIAAFVGTVGVALIFFHLNFAAGVIFALSTLACILGALVASRV